MKVFNGTPHEIKMINPDSVTWDDSRRKYVSAEPEIVHSFASNGVLNAKIEDLPDGELLPGVPLLKRTVTGFDPLPDGYDWYICSALYAVANPDENILVVANPVYHPKKDWVIGCLHLSGILKK